MPHPIPAYSVSLTGDITAASQNMLYARLPVAAIGWFCVIQRESLPPLVARIHGFDGARYLLTPFDKADGVVPGSPVQVTDALSVACAPEDLCGRVIDPFGIPIDGRSALDSGSASIKIFRAAPRALMRNKISVEYATGVRVIDALFPIGVGQRLAVCAAPGCGKSTLLQMIARHSKADRIVIGLVGERGREVRDFLSLINEQGMAERTISVVSTSDESPGRRALAPFTATAIAEEFRSRGEQVLLLIDSLTRAARALRDLTLAAGEPPLRGGYTPSVYRELPQLLERSGNDGHGSITAFYTLLTSEDELGDPLASELKSLLDGHFVLSPRLAEQGLFPAISIAGSLSRLSGHFGDDIREMRDVVKRAAARLEQDRELLLFGAAPDQELSAATRAEPELRALIHQEPHETVPMAESREALSRVYQRLRKEESPHGENITRPQPLQALPSPKGDVTASGQAYRGGAHWPHLMPAKRPDSLAGTPPG